MNSRSRSAGGRDDVLEINPIYLVVIFLSLGAVRWWSVRQMKLTLDSLTSATDSTVLGLGVAETYSVSAATVQDAEPDLETSAGRPPSPIPEARLSKAFEKFELSPAVPPLGVTNKLLYFRPRMAGHYNQLEEFVHAAVVARQMGRALVLPFFAEAVSWDRNKFDIIFPYSDYYDPALIQKVVATVSTKEFLRRCNHTLHVDFRPRLNGKHANPEYERRIGIDVDDVPIRRDGLAVLKRLSPALPECVGIHWPRFAAQPLLRFRRMKADPPLFGMTERNMEAMALQRHIWYSPRIIAEAGVVLKKLPRPYLAVHHRVGDFKQWCRGSYMKSKCPRPDNVWKQILHGLDVLNTTHVFVAVEPRARLATLAAWTERAKQDGRQVTFHSIGDFSGLNTAMYTGRPDVVGMVEHVLCVSSDGFIGNAFSTWSRGVHDRRFVLGKPCDREWLWEREQSNGNVCMDVRGGDAAKGC